MTLACFPQLPAFGTPGPAAYNPEMGANISAEIDARLREGGLVITASDRAARAVTSGFHRARRAQGLKAWPAPNVLDWHRFVRQSWETLSIDSRLLLNSTQEQSLWSGIIARGGHSAVLLEGPRRRLSSMAMEAHQLICSYAPRYLIASTRSAWQQDSAAFSQWLAEYDKQCRETNLLSMSRLPLELKVLLQNNKAPRSPLLLAGFDRLLPIQREVFDAWGDWQTVVENNLAPEIASYTAPDAKSELAACAQWCGLELAAEPQARLLVVTQDSARHRGDIERAFLHHTGSASPRFEFSLGIPLLQTSLARSALLLLRWLAESLEEQELDWLLASGHAASDPQHTAALQAYMRALRRRGLERTQWTLAAFLRQPAGVELPPTWVRQMTQRNANSTPPPNGLSLHSTGLASSRSFLKPQGGPVCDPPPAPSFKLPHAGSKSSKPSALSASTAAASRGRTCSPNWSGS
jgi:hypothetical protein